jgi:hypothetical protein
MASFHQLAPLHISTDWAVCRRAVTGRMVQVVQTEVTKKQPDEMQRSLAKERTSTGCISKVRFSTAKARTCPILWSLCSTRAVLTRQCSGESDAAVDRGRGECAINLAGARWDDKAGSGTLDESRPKELYALMPVVMIKAVMVDKADVKDACICPVYKATARGLTYARRPSSLHIIDRRGTLHRPALCCLARFELAD